MKFQNEAEPAQPEQPAPDVESSEALQQVIQLARARTTQGDEARHEYDFDTAAQCYADAAELFAQLKDLSGLGRTRLEQGDLASYRAELDMAETYYVEAAELFEHPRDRLGLAYARKAQGDLAHRRNDLDTAAFCYAEADGLFEQVHDLSGLAFTSAAQGDLAERRNDLDTAALRYARAASLFEQLHDQLGLARTRKAQGALATARFDYGTAALCYEEAATLYQEASDRLGLANTRLEQGDLAVIRAEFVIAAACFADAAGLFERVRDQLGIAYARKAQGDLASHREEHDTAARCYTEAADLFVHMHDPLGLANTRRAQGDLALRRDDRGTAERSYAEAAVLSAQVQDLSGMAQTRRSEGLLALYNADFATAAALSEQAAGLFERFANWRGLADTCLLQAEIATRRHEFGAADALYRRAAVLFDQVHDGLGLAQTRLSQGRLAEDRTHLATANTLYEQAAAQFSQVHDRLRLAHTRRVQGDLAMRRDHFETAARCYDEASALLSLTHDWLGHADTRRGLGNLAARRGQLDLAAIYYSEAEGAAYGYAQGANREELASTRSLASTRLAQGGLAALRGELVAATCSYDQAAELFARLQDLSALGKTRLTQARLADRRDDVDTAARCYAEAAELYQRLQDRLGLAKTRWGQGDLALKRGDLSEAACLYAWAIQHISHEHTPIYPTVAVPILTVWAAAHLQAARPYAAWLRARGALRLYEALFISQQSAADREIFRRASAQLIGVAVASALRLATAAATEADAQHWHLLAWQVAERHRSAVLLSLSNEGTVLSQTRLNGEEATDSVLGALLDRVADLETELRQLLASVRPDDRPSSLTTTGRFPLPLEAGRETSPSLALLASQTEMRQLLESQRLHLLRELRSRSERLGTAAGDLELPLDRLGQILQEQRAGIVSYVLLPDDTFAALVLRPDGAVHHVPLGRGTTNQVVAEALIDRRRNQHRFQMPWRHWSQSEQLAFERLGDDLWAPIEASGALAGLAHLYVVPDGWLRVLPFAALTWVEHRNDGEKQRFLVDERALTVLLAGGTLVQITEAAKRAGARPGHLAVVVDPARATDKVQPEEAVEAMRRAFASETPLEGAVDRATFAEWVNAAGGLVYLGHGTVGGLVLCDGLFTAEDVRTRLDLYGPVLLGACLLGLEHALEGLAGASTISAFHLVGCSTVLGAALGGSGFGDGQTAGPGAADGKRGPGRLG